MKLSKSEAGKLGRHASKVTQENQAIKRRTDYSLAPNLCKQCACIIVYLKRCNKFCSKSCAATFNNTQKPKRSKHINDTLVKLKIGSKQITCNCAECRTPFTFYPNKHNPSQSKKCCSYACSIKLRHKQKFVLVEQGTASAKYVKRYLVNKHGNNCLDPSCAWDFSKRPINVELEHIDGNSENNTLANCTLLCPNCHSQTSTYKAKNIGNGRAYRRKRYAAGKSY